MSSTGPSRRRRIAGERTTSPSALPHTTPKRPARPVRPAATPRSGGSQTTPPRPPRQRTPRERTPRERTSREREPRGGRTPLLRVLGGAPRRERRRLVPLVLLALVVLVAGAVLAVRGGVEVWQARSVDGAREAAASAAGTAIEDMYTYDSRDLEEARSAERLMTPAFRRQYADIIETLGQLGDERQVTIESTARDVAAMPCGDECSATRQRVMVFFDLSRTTGEGTVPSVFGNRVALTMVDRDGDWLVGDIQVL